MSMAGSKRSDIEKEVDIHKDTMPESNGQSSSGSTMDSDKVHLRRQIGVTDSVAMTVGIIIGSGIFISPSGILRFTGSIGWSLVVWVFCGVLSTLGALSFAELGTTFPVSGGSYSYILKCYGRGPAFLKLYNEIVASSSGGVAVLGIAFANYILLPFYPPCFDSYVPARLLAALILCFSTFVNCYSVPCSRGLNIFFTSCKVLGLLVIVGFGVARVVQGDFGDFEDPGGVFPDKVPFHTFPLAVYSGLFAYSGWQNLFSVTEEIIRPSRTIPLSITISLFFVTIIYLLVNVAYFLLLSQHDILVSNAIALDVGRQVLGSWWWTLSVVVALSIAGSLNGVSLARARLFYVASREGHMPEIASMIHVTRKTPLPATIVTVPFSLLLLLTDDVYSLINYAGATGWLFSGLVVSIVPYYRWKYPQIERPFKVPVIIPIVFTMCCFFVVAMSFYGSPIDCGIGVAITISGVPVYFFIQWKNKPSWITDSLKKMTIFLQKLMFVVPQEDVDSLTDCDSNSTDDTNTRNAESHTPSPPSSLARSESQRKIE